AVVELARYGDDLRRTLGPPRRLGTTPLATTIAPGSYLIAITAAGRDPVRYPVLVERGAPVHIDIAVPAHVPPGYIYIPPGRFLYGTADDDRLRVGFFNTQPIHALDSAGYLIARHEVTFADWIEYLEALPAAERRARTPSAGDDLGMIRLEPITGGWRLVMQPEGPGGPVLSATSGQRLHYPGRTRRAYLDWRRFPVSGISWEDVLAYTAWLRSTGRLPGARPCSEREWERAARGADDRRYPHGDVLAPDDADHDATYGRAKGAYGPDEVGSHPASDSPFGVADMVGNVAEWSRSVRSPQLAPDGAPAHELQPDDMVLRSATFYRDALSNQIVTRNFGTATLRHNQLGARICADAPDPEARGP
ncbi:MAG TPA: SUMF1/EgtB/PvdO family nonheme iron enzyme, partial [Kofleriaceae bacterium]